MKIQKCKCGSDRIEQISKSKGIELHCKDCGQTVELLFSDPFLKAMSMKIFELSKELNQFLLTQRWNEAQQKDE